MEDIYDFKTLAVYLSQNLSNGGTVCKGKHISEGNLLRNGKKSLSDVLKDKEEFWYIDLGEDWKNFVNNEAPLIVRRVQEFSKYYQRNLCALETQINKKKKEESNKIPNTSHKICFFSPQSDVGAHITIRPPQKENVLGKKVTFKIESVESYNNNKIGNPSEFSDKHFTSTWCFVLVSYIAEESEYIPFSKNRPHITICCHGIVFD